MSSQDNLQEDLINAILSANLSQLQLCISNGANVNDDFPLFHGPLYYAASKGHTEIVNLLLESGGDINKCSLFGDTPLAGAAGNGHKNVIEQLIAAGGDVNEFKNGGMTPLGRAAIGGHLDIIKILLQSGGDINMCDGHGNTALAHAANSQTDSRNILQHLLSVGADVNNFGEGGQTPLMCAARFGSVENVKLLVDNEADITIRDFRGMTAVDYAASDKNNSHIVEYLKNEKIRKTFYDCIKANNLQMAKALIANEANVNKAEDNGETPLVCAVKIGTLEMIELLLDNGAQFSIPSAFLTAIKTNNLEIVQFLIKSGADVNLQYRNGNTPLLQAIEVENLQIVKLLVENGADVNLLDKNGNVPLIKAVETQKWDLAEFLILSGADVVNYPFLLIKYIQERNTKMVKLLIEEGVSLDFVSDCGFTPLTKCVTINSYQLLDYLVQKGANVNKTDNNKDTPLSLAALNANFKMFDYLLKAGADLEQVKEKLDEVAANDEDFAAYLSLLQKQKIQGGHNKIIDSLLSSGIDSNQEEAP